MCTWIVRVDKRGQNSGQSSDRLPVTSVYDHFVTPTDAGLWHGVLKVWASEPLHVWMQGAKHLCTIIYQQRIVCHICSHAV